METCMAATAELQAQVQAAAGLICEQHAIADRFPKADAKLAR